MRPSLGLAIFAARTAAQSVIDLSGDGWTVQNLPLNISIPGHLPSHSHLDLYAAHATGDPYYGTNDFNLRWIVYNNWTYLSDPIDGLSFSANTTTYLLFDGLDTYTTISLCNQHVANTDNQFRQYYFDVSDILRNCSRADAILDLNFGSVPLISQAIANEPGQMTWPPSAVFPDEFPNRQWVRKSQSDFGWNWSPAFLPVGPWKPAYVVQLAENELHVHNSDFDLYRQGQLNNLPPDQSKPWVLNASIDVLGNIPADASMRYSIFDLDSKRTVSTGSLKDVNTTQNGGTLTGIAILDEYNYELWWPNGMGPQKLFNITVEVWGASNQSLAAVTHRMGFRTIVMNQTPISSSQLAQGELCNHGTISLFHHHGFSLIKELNTSNVI
jgi:beta-mannosidase